MKFKDVAKPGDIHVVVSASQQTMNCFDFSGKKQWGIEAHCVGQLADWRQPNGDTPRGMYEVGVIYDTPGEAAYGDWCIDLEDLEGQESDNGRAGISIHGGGSASPRPFADKQGWYPTHGCIRCQNGDMRQRVYPTFKSVKAAKRKVFVTVVD